MIWPFSSRKAAPAPEAKSLAVPTPDLLDVFGIPASALPTITVEQALRVPAVSCAIRTIAEAAASLGVVVKEVGPDGTETDLPDHPVSRLLRSDVNGWMLISTQN